MSNLVVDILQGSVRSKRRLIGQIGTKHQLIGKISPGLNNSNAYPIYDGSYKVTPSSSEQTLETKEKLLIDDITVKSIPYHEISNDSGGRTVYIGTDVEVE